MNKNRISIITFVLATQVLSCGLLNAMQAKKPDSNFINLINKKPLNKTDLKKITKAIRADKTVVNTTDCYGNTPLKCAGILCSCKRSCGRINELLHNCTGRE